MSSQTILYDLPSQQGTAWSLNPWKTRLILNYKGIDYRTEWVEFPDVEPKMKSFPSLHLDDPVTIKIRDHISKILGPIMLQFLPKVPYLLPERSQGYFYKSREEAFGKPLSEVHEEALANSEEGWKAAQEPLKEAADLLKKHDGPFFLGQTVSYADFIFVSMLYFVKRLDEQVYQKLVSFDPAFTKVYEASRQWFTKDN